MSTPSVAREVNQRKHRRTVVSREIRIEPLRTGRRYIGLFGNGQAPAPAPGRMVDIGCGGMAARVPGALEIGTQVDVHIEHGSGAVQRTRGTVRNVRGDNGTRTLGIAFIEPMIALGDPESPATSVAPEGGEPQALVVDDDANAQRVLKRFLRGRGLRVTSASNADEALEILRHENPALMILELTLDGFGGVELLETMSAEGLRVPHLWAVSGRADDDQALAALSLGADEFFDKPLDLDQLDRSLQSLSPML